VVALHPQRGDAADFIALFQGLRTKARIIAPISWRATDRSGAAVQRPVPPIGGTFHGSSPCDGDVRGRWWPVLFRPPERSQVNSTGHISTPPHVPVALTGPLEKCTDRVAPGRCTAAPGPVR